VTEGGVNGDRSDRFGEGSRAGSEMNILVGAKANFDDVSARECDEVSSDDLLLLFNKATVIAGAGRAIKKAFIVLSIVKHDQPYFSGGGELMVISLVIRFWIDYSRQAGLFS